ncbi:glycosyltransferase family 4 protein [Brachybacterium sp. GCM10030268]|uniref:glycosyltransferase family 4 protein n=1 Tax=Brachybacterium sp. GCM10030268 TaxID=3273382 RepID=UPI003608CEF6
MPSPRQTVRNARLLVQSCLQHLVDDPALLAVQASRRLPFWARVRVGKGLLDVGRRIPGGTGVAALGAFMAGDGRTSAQLLERSTGSRSALRGEVAVLLDRADLISTNAPASTRARAAWMRGQFTAAVTILEKAGQGRTRYAQRLRSELQLLQPGYRLPVSQRATPVRASLLEKPARVLCLVTNSLPHTQSGYSLRTHRILTALSGEGIASVALTRTGYPVMVGLPTAAKEDVVDGIRYVRTLPERLPRTQEDRLLAEVERALALVEEFRPHILHATTNYYNALVAQAVAEVTGLPWVLEVRGLMEETWIASLATAEGRKFAATSEKPRLIAARRAELVAEADAVVTLSETMAADLERHGVDRSRVAIVPNGVDESLLEDHVTPEEARQLLGLKRRDSFMVGAVSALVDYEGFDTLLRAVALLLTEDSAPSALREQLYVAIAGDGSAAPALRTLARELGIEDRVLMPGRVPRDRARDWVQALNVVVVPRRDVEVARTVTPQKPVEAMALGRPVIVSDLPALRETITDDTGHLAGLLTPAGNAEALATQIHALWADAPRRDELGEKGRSLAASRTWSAMVRRYDAVYTQAASERREGAARGK